MENYSENSIKSDVQNSLQIFKYCDQKVRTVTKNGEVFFVLKDVCDVLELSNSRKVSDRLDEDEKDVTFGYTPGGSQNLTIINESGLYKVIFRSNKPEAKKFMHWVTHEVLPSIRKHGAYITTQKMEELMQNPDTWIKLIQTLQQERQEKQKLQDQIETDKPKVLFADAVATSESDVLIGELAKILKGNGIEIGQNRLFEKLRQDGFLIRRDGSDLQHANAAGDESWPIQTERNCDYAFRQPHHDFENHKSYRKRPNIFRELFSRRIQK